MALPAIGTQAGSVTAANIILSIRDQIPDQPQAANNADSDGNDFTAAALIRWINDAMRVIASTAPVVMDWYAVQSTSGMDVYELPSTILSVEQVWYDLEPLARSPEFGDLSTSKVTAKSYFFGPHSIHATPRLHVWPACDRTGQTTTLSAQLASTDTSIALTSSTNFKAYGYVKVESEVLLYRTVTGNTLSNILHAQGGTAAATHGAATTVTELNLFFKCSRLPTPIGASADAVEIPIGLTPLIELYVLSKVRQAEQEHQAASVLSSEFQKSMQALASKAQYAGIRQGIQVGSSDMTPPYLYGGRVIVP